MFISMQTAKTRLAILWFSWYGILFMVILIQTIGGVHKNIESKVWGWFLPTVMPTLSLMISVFIADASKENKQADKVKRQYFRLTFFLSLFYLFIVTVTFVGQVYWVDLVSYFEKSNMFLGPLQGLTAGMLLFFFQKKEVTP